MHRYVFNFETNLAMPSQRSLLLMNFLGSSQQETGSLALPHQRAAKAGESCY